jgi:hypothetical protein
MAPPVAVTSSSSLAVVLAVKRTAKSVWLRRMIRQLRSSAPPLSSSSRMYCSGQLIRRKSPWQDIQPMVLPDRQTLLVNLQGSDRVETSSSQAVPVQLARGEDT